MVIYGRRAFISLTTGQDAMVWWNDSIQLVIKIMRLFLTNQIVLFHLCRITVCYNKICLRHRVEMRGTEPGETYFVCPRNLRAFFKSLLLMNPKSSLSNDTKEFLSSANLSGVSSGNASGLNLKNDQIMSTILYFEI